MPIENIPEIFFVDKEVLQDIFVYDFKMISDVVKSKVNLSMNMFSFLQVGKKQVHFADTSMAVNSQQSLLLKKGIGYGPSCLTLKLFIFVNSSFFRRKN